MLKGFQANERVFFLRNGKSNIGLNSLEPQKVFIVDSLGKSSDVSTLNYKDFERDILYHHSKNPFAKSIDVYLKSSTSILNLDFSSNSTDDYMNRLKILKDWYNTNINPIVFDNAKIIDYRKNRRNIFFENGRDIHYSTVNAITNSSMCEYENELFVIYSENLAYNGIFRLKYAPDDDYYFVCIISKCSENETGKTIKFSEMQQNAFGWNFAPTLLKFNCIYVNTRFDKLNFSDQTFESLITKLFFHGDGGYLYIEGLECKLKIEKGMTKELLEEMIIQTLKDNGYVFL